MSFLKPSQPISLHSSFKNTFQCSTSVCVLISHISTFHYCFSWFLWMLYTYQDIYCIWFNISWPHHPLQSSIFRRYLIRNCLTLFEPSPPLPHLVNMVTVNSMMVSIPTVPQHLLCLSAIHIVIPRLLWECAWPDSCNTTAAVWQTWWYTNYIHARSEAVTPVLMRIHIFWDVTVSKTADAGLWR